MGSCLCVLNLVVSRVRLNTASLWPEDQRVVIGGSTVLVNDSDESMMAAHSFGERLGTNEADVQPLGRHYAVSP